MYGGGELDHAEIAKRQRKRLKRPILLSKHVEEKALIKQAGQHGLQQPLAYAQSQRHLQERKALDKAWEDQPGIQAPNGQLDHRGNLTSLKSHKTLQHDGDEASSPVPTIKRSTGPGASDSLGGRRQGAATQLARSYNSATTITLPQIGRKHQLGLAKQQSQSSQHLA